MKIALALILTVCAGAGALIYSRGGENSGASAKRGDKDSFARVERGNLRVTLSSEGKISAKESVKLSHTIEGTLTITKLVAEGTQVEAGAELVVFDGAKQKQDVETAEAECKSSATEVEIAQKAVEITERENAESLATAQFKYNAAKMECEKVEKGEMPQNERKMLLEIEKWESEVKQAKEAYESITDKEVLAQGFVTPAEIEKERLRYRTAQIQAEFSASELEVFRKYTRPVALNAKKADVEATKANVATIESVNANKLRQKTAELEAKQEKLRQVKSRLETAKEKLAGTVLKAPCAGLALYGEQMDQRYYYGQENYVRVGGQVYTNQTIITLPKLEELIVKTAVPEADINKVKEGMRVSVTSVAYPDFRETATVTKTGNVAQRSYFDATNQYEVTIQLRKGITGIKPGVSTKLEIEIEDLKDVLKVPVSAVFNKQGQDIVYLSDRKPRNVKVGSSNDTHAVILEGLKEGDSVLLFEPEETDSNKPEPATAAKGK